MAQPLPRARALLEKSGGKKHSRYRRYRRSQEIAADSVADEQEDEESLVDAATDVDIDLDGGHDIDPLVLDDDDHDGLPAPSTPSARRRHAPYEAGNYAGIDVPSEY